MVNFNYVALIPKVYKYPRIILLVRIFLMFVTKEHSILYVFYEVIVTSKIFSFRFVLYSVWMYLRVQRLYTSKFLCHYPVLLLAFVSIFFTSVYTILPRLHLYFKRFKDILSPKYFVRQESL